MMLDQFSTWRSGTGVAINGVRTVCVWSGTANAVHHAVDSPLSQAFLQENHQTAACGHITVTSFHSPSAVASRQQREVFVPPKCAPLLGVLLSNEQVPRRFPQSCQTRCRIPCRIHHGSGQKPDLSTLALLLSMTALCVSIQVFTTLLVEWKPSGSTRSRKT